MEERGIATLDRELPCPECGYDLRGRSEDGDEGQILCPECGVRSSVVTILDPVKPFSPLMILLPAFAAAGITFLTAIGLIPALILVPVLLLATPPYLIWCATRTMTKGERKKRPLDLLFQAGAFLLANLFVGYFLLSILYVLFVVGAQ